MKGIIIILLGLLLYAQGASQHEVNTQTDVPPWVDEMYNAKTTHDIQNVMAMYTAYYKVNKKDKTDYTQAYKRWVRSLGRAQDGVYLGLESYESIQKENQNYVAKSNTLLSNKSGNSSWQALGPIDYDEETPITSYTAGTSHVYTVEQAQTNPNIMYVGTATAGVWKSTNGGESWELKTRDLLVNAVLAIEIDRSNHENIIFGGGYALYKSTNGGDSWKQIVIHQEGIVIVDIVQHPTNHKEYFLASDRGLYRSQDGGDTWNVIENTDGQDAAFLEIEMHPTNPYTVYAVKRDGKKTEFYKSTNGGSSFSKKTNGWPDANAESGGAQQRTEIAVSKSNPDNVYALAAGIANGGKGLFGFYLSKNAGESWEFKCCGNGPGGNAGLNNRNILGYSTQGLISGGQFNYDLALAVSDQAPNELFTGGIMLWRSNSDGSLFTNYGDWNHNYNKDQYVHADIHDIKFFDNKLWVASDGGLYYSADRGKTFQKKMLGIQGTDFRGFDAGYINGDVMIGGTYHNSTLLKNKNTYKNGWVSMNLDGVGGDNIRGFVNPGMNDIVYLDKSGRQGRIRVPASRNLMYTKYNFEKEPNASFNTIGEDCNLEFHPNYYNCVYSGVGDELWFSEDNGDEWTMIHDFNGGKVTSIQVANSDPNVIYVVQFIGSTGSKTKIWKSTDKGRNWNDITPGKLIRHAEYPIQIQVSATDANRAWIARIPQFAISDPLDNAKVFETTNGGDFWKNITDGTLDGEMITNIQHQRGSDLIYVGTRRAVYYKDGSSGWKLYNAELPVSTFSTNLVPFYKGGKLRNGTNRGAYEVDFAKPSSPIAIPAVDKTDGDCGNDIFYFEDISVVDDRSASYEWTFEGGSPASSTESSPEVSFFGSGDFDVTLTVKDANGTHTTTIENMVSITGCAAILPVEWLSFDASRIGKQNIKLEWTTGTEVNVSHYEVQKSNDAYDFITIGEQIPKEKTKNEYSFMDYDPYVGYNYYRIKNVDFDGRESFSEVIQVNVNTEEEANVLIFPNPTTPGVNVLLKSNITQEAKVLLFNHLGQKLMESNFTTETQISTEDLLPGVYQIVVLENDRKTTQSLIVQ